MIEKLKPQTYRKVKDGVAIYTGIEDTEEYNPPLSPAEEKINEIIDALNELTKPSAAVLPTKKRTAREIVRELIEKHINEQWSSAFEYALEEFDLEGIE